MVRVWEHEVFEDIEAVMARVRAALQLGDWEPQATLRVVCVEAIDDERNLERRYLEALRKPDHGETREGRRTTKKWRRPTR